MHAQLEPQPVLVARREVGREQDLGSVDVRKALEDPLDLSRRHAFEGSSGGPHALEDLCVRIGLQGVQHAVDRLECDERDQPFVDGLGVVDVRGLVVSKALQQSLALFAPTTYAVDSID